MTNETRGPARAEPWTRHGGDTPSDWVVAHLPPAADGRRRLLDVACGGGRHTRVAIRAGYHVTAIDRDLAGVADLAGRPDVTLVHADLEDGSPWPLAVDGRAPTFDVVLVTNYLWRPAFPTLCAAVAADGMLIYETFAVGQARFGRPTNPAFLLRPAELIDAVRAPASHGAGLVPIAFEHRRLDDPPRLVQRIVAVGPEHPGLVGG
jgi:SAM-dependent methyltransferase